MLPMMTAMGLNQLSPSERVALALEIWESLGDDRSVGPLSPGQVDELGRRDAELDANPELALTWEQIRLSVEGRR